MDDVKALTAIVSMLRNLDEQTQRRVLTSVHTMLGLSTQGWIHAKEELDLPMQAEPVISSFSADRTMSPKEFLREKHPVTDVDRVACLAYYLTHYKGTPHFKTIDISALNVDAAQPKFSSTSVAVDNARAKGLLVPSTKGNKQLSAIGEKYVELLPDKEAAMASLTVRKQRKVVKKTKPRKRG